MGLGNIFGVSLVGLCHLRQGTWGAHLPLHPDFPCLAASWAPPAPQSRSSRGQGALVTPIPISPEHPRAPQPPRTCRAARLPATKRSMTAPIRAPNRQYDPRVTQYGPV